MNYNVRSTAGKLSELLESREKAVSEVKRTHQQTNEAVENDNRRVLVELLVTSCGDAMTKIIKKHDQLLKLTPKIDDSASLLKVQETWLNVLRIINNEVLKQARQYINSKPATDKTSQK